MKQLIVLAALATLAAPVAAQAPAAKPTPAPTKTARAPVVRTQKSLDCSKQADAQNVHGKPRKAFMAKCKKA